MTSPEANAAPPWARMIATVFGTGYLRPGPGTWASVATVLAWWAIARTLPETRVPYVAAGLAALAVLVGIPAATRVARASRVKDPQFVVIDETAGQLITLIGAPLTWPALLAGLLLFRAFDIIKPPPVRWLERVPEGAGIVLDDVAAGLYALLALQALLRFGVLH